MRAAGAGIEIGGLSALTTITVRFAGEEEVLDLEDFERRVASGEIDLFTEVCFPPLTGEGFKRVGEIEPFRRLAPPRGIYFEHAFHLGRFPRITVILCLANLALYLLQRQKGPITVGTLVAYGAKAGPLLHDLGEWWRLLTANFVHVSPIHIGFNLFVIFHFGAAVENAYRPFDYLFVLLAAALGTTLASYAHTDALTMGASGMAYGLLGSAVVFGIKYRRMLPRRYRAVLGAATLPTVAVYLYMGFRSEGIDNWGHLGGLFAGALATLPLRPRLLSPRPDLRRLLVDRVLPLAAVLVVLVLGSSLSARFLPRLVEIYEPDHGVVFAVPKGWHVRRPGVFDNALPLHARASFSVFVLPVEGQADPFEAVRAFTEEELGARVATGVVRIRGAGAILPTTLGGVDGARRRLELEVEGVPTVFTTTYVARGDRLFRFVATRPVDLPAYDRVLARITDSVLFLD